MRIVLDSSALAKRYVAEPGTERVLELCSEAQEIILSVLCVPEILSVLNRLKQEGGLSKRQYLELKEALAADVEQATIVTITQAVVIWGIEVLEETSLHTLDAIHVATALDSGCELFVSADRLQCTAARQLGLTVEEIGLEKNP